MSEPLSATTNILLNADGASVAFDSQTDAADVTFHCDTATAILVIFGRLSLADAIAEGTFLFAVPVTFKTDKINRISLEGYDEKEQYKSGRLFDRHRLPLSSHRIICR